MQKDNLQKKSAKDSATNNDISIQDIKECIEFSGMSDKEAEHVLNSIKEFTTIIFLYYCNSTNKTKE